MPPQGEHVRRAEDVPKIAAAVAVVAGTAVVAARGLPDAERSVFVAVHGLPSWLTPVLWAPMQLGNAVAPLAVGGLAWWRWRRWRPSVGVVVVGLVGWYTAKGIKRLVDRGRPAAELPDFVLHRSAPTDGLGFVSGHATVAFGCAAVISPYLSPRTRVLAYALAATVGFSRIQVGAHLPLDVVGGAALGLGLGWTWNLVVGVPARRR